MKANHVIRAMLELSEVSDDVAVACPMMEPVQSMVLSVEYIENDEKQ